MKILIPETVNEKGLEYLRERGYEIVMGSGPQQDVLKREIVDADAIMARYADYNADVLACAKNLKIIARHGVGVNNIDAVTAEKLGIWVTKATAANSNSVAEHTLMLMLMLAKCVPQFKDCLVRGDWEKRNIVTQTLEEMQGKTVGIIGLGAIGTRVAQKAHYGFDMNIIGYDPYIDYTKLPNYVTGMMSAEEVFEKADFITMHCPHNEETHGYITAREIEMMKPTAYIINCARGGLIDEDALYDALVNKRIAAAALDVFEHEPPASDNKLFKLDNFYGTPHQAGMSLHAYEACSLSAAKSIDEALSGKKPRFPVNNPENPRNMK